MISRSNVLLDNVVDMFFLMKYCLLGVTDVEFEPREEYVSLAKEYFDILQKDEVEEDVLNAFSVRKFELLDSIFQIHHEFTEDDVKLDLERKLLGWEFNRIQTNSAKHKNEREIPTNVVSEEEFFNE